MDKSSLSQLNPRARLAVLPANVKESMIDATHDPRRQSWVESANGHSDFPIQNLPFVIFSARGGKPRGGVVIGQEIVDLGQACTAGLLTGAAADAAEAASGPRLKPLFALGATPGRARRAVRLACGRWSRALPRRAHGAGVAAQAGQLSAASAGAHWRLH